MATLDKNDDKGADKAASKDAGKELSKDEKGKGEVKLASVAAGAAAAVAPAPTLPPRDAKRDQAIDLALSTIEKQFGKGSIMRLGDELPAPEVKVVPTGSLGLDIALGCGGLPRGRVVEIYGPESSGKPPWPCTWSPRPSAKAASALSSTPNTRSTSATRANSACAPTTFWSHNPTAASRRSRSPRCWSARGRSTSWWSTRLRRSPRRPSSRAKWVIPTSVCRPG